jgi:hypothetical protein
LVLACAVALIARSAAAEDALGKRLFEEGKAAMAARDFPTACAKFQASFEESSVPGALLSWADCEEQRGRLGTALGLWQKGAELVAADFERSSFVRNRIAALDVRVPKLRIVLPRAAKNPQVTLDGRAVAFDAPLPLDPGAHQIEARAEGLGPEQKRIDLAPGATATLSFFEEAVQASEPATGADAPPPPGADDDDGSVLVTAGWVVGAVGLAGAAGFAITGGLVLDSCHGTLDPCGGAEGRDAGKVLALTRANAAFATIGLAGLATGAILLGVGYASPPAKAGAVDLRVRVGAGTFGVDGVFR